MVPHVLIWRSVSMPAPAFWYFPSQAAALAARDTMPANCNAWIEPRRPADYRRWIERTHSMRNAQTAAALLAAV